MAALENKNVEPVVAVLANWFVLGLLGYVMLGQTNKGVMVMVTTFLGSCLCVLPGLLVAILGLADVFAVATAVKNGEVVDENEYKNEMLYKVVKMLHKDAVFNA